MKKTYIPIKPSLKPLLKAPVFLFEPPSPVDSSVLRAKPHVPASPGQLVSEVGSTSVCPEKMEALIDHIIKGQDKLEKAMESQLSSAQADRDLFTHTITAQLETLKNINPAPLVAQGEVRVHAPHPPGVSLQKYVTGDDPDAFLVNFERAARALSWPEEKWPFFLAPLLTGEAQSAYQAANPLGTTPYATIKMVILDHLGLDQEAYRVRFRKERGIPGENPKTLFYRLKMSADKWLRPDICNKEDILKKIYLEQFMEALPYATQRWLRQHVGLTVEHAIEMASQYARAQPKSLTWEPDKTPKHLPPPKLEKKFKGGLEPPRPLRPPSMVFQPPNKGPQCFDCGEWGHIARMCPKRKPPEEPMEVGYIPRTVLYSAEMGSTFYHSPAAWTEEESSVWFPEYTDDGPFKTIEYGTETPPPEDARASKADTPGKEMEGAWSRAENPEEADEKHLEAVNQEDDKPGGHRFHAAPCHVPTGGAWLQEVRGRVAGWVGRRKHQ
ncbi:uncharacterized protein LOC144825352 [Lissotriton helveticus]